MVGGHHNGRVTQPWYHPHLREGLLSATASAGCNPISELQGQFSPLSALSALIHKKTKSPISTHASRANVRSILSRLLGVKNLASEFDLILIYINQLSNASGRRYYTLKMLRSLKVCRPIWNAPFLSVSVSRPDAQPWFHKLDMFGCPTAFPSSS